MLTWWTVLAALVAGAAACPQHCACFTDPDDYKSANCSTQALGSVQPSSLDRVSFLPQEHGYPTKLAPRAFLSFKKVKFLWIINCSVLNLPDDVFHGLNYVIKMDLSYNKIRHLNGGVFKPLGSLHTLLLRGNPLMLTPWDSIVSDSLQELDLGHCGLRTIPQGTFTSTPRLTRLYLDGNEIHTFTFNMIPAVLRYLNLARNRIVNVPTDVIAGMSYLRKLDLSKNPIRCNCNLLIMQDWFSGQGVIFENGVTCTEPSQYAGQQLSKINENEFCTKEEVKRQRRINDIENFRDSKAHRTHNMIHDPDLQSDQPDGELYSEVLFDNDGTRALGTHMELTERHYILPSDFSDENNKLAAGKQDLVPTEIDFASPTKAVESVNIQEIPDLNITEIFNENSNESLSVLNHDLNVKNLTFESLTRNDSDHLSEVEFPSNFNISSVSKDSLLSLKLVHPTISPENEMADEGYSPLYSSTPHSKLNLEGHDKTHSEKSFDQELADQPLPTFQNFSGSDREMADEGFSPVYNASNTVLDEEVGSGDDDIQDILHTTISNDDVSKTQANYTFPTSQIDSHEYSYDTVHDYSAEVMNTTEAMDSTELEEEGSGGLEDDLTIGTSSHPYYTYDKNETTTENYLKTEMSTDFDISLETTSENDENSEPESYDATTLGYLSSSQIQLISETASTEETTTESFTIEPLTDLIGIASETTSISSSSEASSTSPGLPTTSEPIISSSSSEQPVIITELTTEIPVTSTELPSSSTSGTLLIIPSVEVEASSSTPDHTEFHKAIITPSIIQEVETTTLEPSVANEVEVISGINKEDEKGLIRLEPTPAEREEGRMETAQSTLTYIIVGLLIALVLLIATTVLCRKMSKMGPCTSKKKVRLPQDTEATLGTEMQDMLLPKPPENGVKIISHNGTQNGKEVIEEEIPVLQKDWDEKPEPIETVTARMSILAGPQTPVFIHKTLA